jgi:hypothetical protein
VIGQKVLMTSNILSYTHFFPVFEFKFNFINKYFNNIIIKQLIDQLYFKSKQNITPKPIWGWPWFEILEFTPLKVSGSIPTGANFGGQVHTELALA